MILGEKMSDWDDGDTIFEFGPVSTYSNRGTWKKNLGEQYSVVHMKNVLKISGVF